LTSTTQQSALSRLIRSGRVQFGLALMSLVVFIAVFGPLFAINGPTDLVGIPFDPPQDTLPLGTDFLGRDVLARFLYGGRNLVWMSVCASGFGLALGTALGLTAAYNRGWVDSLIMRTVEVKLAFPSVIFALLIVTVLGPGKWLLVCLVGISQAPSVARVLRGAALPLIEKEYVQYCQAIGLPGWKIVLTQLLPNVTTPLLVEAGLRLMWAISLLAGLSFIGYGIQPPEADWGVMINENRNALSIQPWAVVVPIGVIALFTIGGNIFAEGILRTLSRTDSGEERA
jgi:peptide/nickel transport system permease protein